MYKYFTHDNKELDFSISLYGFQCGCYTAVLRRRIRHVWDDQGFLELKET